MYSDIPDKNATEGPRGWLFYDAACPLCARWAERSRGLLRRRRIELLPLQGDGVAGRLGIPETDLLKEMRFLIGLFHPPFIHNVILPFLGVVGAS